MKTLQFDASVGVMNSKQNAVDFCERQQTKGSQFCLEQVQYVKFYSLLAKKAQLWEADIAHKNCINV